MAEALHHQVGGEAQTGQLLHFVSSHRPGRVLGSDRGHQRLATGAGAHTVEAAGLTHHFLSQGESLASVLRSAGADEQLGRRQTKLGAHLVGEGSTDHQRNAATGAHLITDRGWLEFEAAHHLTIPFDRALVGANGDHIAGVQTGDITFDRQRARVFRGVEKDGGDFSAQNHSTGSLVWDVWNVIARVPEHRVDGALA